MKILKLSIALLIGLGSFAYANEAKAKTVIIFDASGSMWGQINKKPKIEMAKKALNKFVKDWDEAKLGELGITVYGHRKKKDCKDIEAIIPVGKVDKEKIYAKIKKIQPKGKTPISLAIEQEVKKLKNTDVPVTIVLISDGIDSCNGDPCKTVKRLISEGVKFKLPVVGFDVNKKASKQLQCIADAAGSVFVKAGGSMTALTKAMEEVIKPTSIKAENDDFSKNVINSKIGGNAGNVILNDMFNDTQADSSMININFEGKKNISIDQEGNLMAAKGMQAGNHTIQYKICEKRRTDNCSSAEVSLVVKDITNTSIVSKDSGTPVSATYQFFTMNSSGEADKKLDHECTSNESEPCTLDLKKGNYLILSTAGNKKGEALVTIEKDQALKESDIQKIIVDLK